MRSGVTALALLLTGCVPGFGQFTRVDPSSDGGALADGAVRDGGGVDGGASDAGPGGCADGLLSCAPTCDTILDAVFVDESYEVDLGTTTFSWVGSASVTAGHLELDAPDTWLITNSSWSFGDTIACAEVELAFGEIDAASGFFFGVRGTDHGTLVRMTPPTSRVDLAVFNPARTAVDVHTPFPIPSGGATERFVVLSYLGADHAHGEVRRVSTGEVVVLHGGYSGDSLPLQVEISLNTVSGVARVDWLRVGTPTAEARAYLEGGG